MFIIEAFNRKLGGLRLISKLFRWAVAKRDAAYFSAEATFIEK